LAVRPSRVRRLRIHRTIQATTIAAGLALAGGVLYVAAQTNVTLIVGSHVESISTSSRSVRELLEGEGIELSHDTRVVPPLATVLADGMTVVVSPSPAAPVALRDVGTGTVFQALTGVGVWAVEGTSSGPAVRITAELVEASASASRVGPSPVVSVRAVVAGKVYDVLTNARTAGELLSAMGIAPDVDDRVLPLPSTPLHVGAIVAFDRVSELTTTHLRSTPFPVRTTWTSELAPGEVQVISRGGAGLAYVTEGEVWVNGRLESHAVVTKHVLRPARAEIRLSGPMSPTIPQEAAGGHKAAGGATWYDPPWSGLTAASPWIPFGTRVTVTDLASGRTVIVVIDDRGPFGAGRIIDLSPEAFSALAPLGRGVLSVRISW
jgi:uncharacterized protein YabE (DUF348 family)